MQESSPCRTTSRDLFLLFEFNNILVCNTTIFKLTNCCICIFFIQNANAHKKSMRVNWKIVNESPAGARTCKSLCFYWIKFLPRGNWRPRLKKNIYNFLIYFKSNGNPKMFSQIFRMQGSPQRMRLQRRLNGIYFVFYILCIPGSRDWRRVFLSSQIIYIIFLTTLFRAKVQF